MASTAKLAEIRNLDREQLFHWLNSKAPAWVSMLLVMLIAWQLAKIVWMLIPGGDSGTPVVIPDRATTSMSDVQPSAQAIADASLFGTAEKDEANAGSSAPVSGTDIDSLPDARVNFSLKGTVAVSDPARSVAIIADTSNKEQVYGIGDMVQPGTSIEEIHQYLVVLNQNGALSKLEIPKDFPAGTTSVRRGNQTTNRSQPTANTASIQNVVAQNVSKLADVIRPTPYFVGGQQQGYRVYPGRDRRQFAALGLRPGDLIKDIDGASLTDPKQAMEIFQNLGSADQVSVTVERNGQPQTLVLKTEQLDITNQ